MDTRHQKAAISLAGPAIVLMLVILIAPIIIALTLSFTSYSMGSDGFDWVGFKNYQNMVTRSTYQKMFTSTLTYVVVVVPLSVLLGLGSALLINSLRFGKNLYKTIYFLPVMATLLAMAIVWEFALHPSIGIINDTLSQGCDSGFWYPLLSGSWLGADAGQSWYGQSCSNGFPLWLGDPDYSLWTICFIGVWQAFGFNMVLYLAGLTSVPRELIQAAQMDGASTAWSRFWLVTWPMLGPTTVFVISITLIRSFQVFDTVEALTHGGPIKSTYVMMFAIYEKAIQQNLVGMGASITVVFLLFVLILTLTQRYLVERKVHYS